MYIICVCGIYIYIYIYKIKKNISYFHRTFQIALNYFSTVKSDNSATAFTKNENRSVGS